MTSRLRLRSLIASLLLAACALPGVAAANPTVLIEPATGEVLAHEDAFRRWYPASLTKLMTAYVAFRAVKAGEIQLTSGVRVSKHAAKMPPSKMGYAPGSVMTLDTALRIIMVKSANDVATAIGENVGKGEANFVRRMNEEAGRLGMIGTHFTNANGLHDENQYSTARDLAILASQLRIEFPEYMTYFDIPALAAGDKVMENFNPLIGRFDGANGMKTGFICPSGFNLIASATRGGRTLIAVVLGATTQQGRAETAAEMLAKGYAGAFPSPVRIAELAPYGENLAAAANMREQICSKTAQSERSGQRDEEGRLVFNSPYMSDLDSRPMAIAIGLGGADDEGWVAPEYADVPVPTPRPDYDATTEAAAVQGDTPLRQ